MLEPSSPSVQSFLAKDWLWNFEYTLVYFEIIDAYQITTQKRIWLNFAQTNNSCIAIQRKKHTEMKFRFYSESIFQQRTLP